VRAFAHSIRVLDVVLFEGFHQLLRSDYEPVILAAGYPQQFQLPVCLFRIFENLCKALLWLRKYRRTEAANPCKTIQIVQADPKRLTAVLLVTTSWTFVYENSSIIADFNLPFNPFFTRFRSSRS
jgi:hypothetical protein